jgi:hypothetical protein
MSESILSFSNDITNAPPPPLLPVGPYPAEIIGAIKKQGNAGEFAQITFRINAESYPADFQDGDPDGIILQYNFLKTADTPTNMHRWRVFLEKIGGPLGRSIDLNSLIGLTATVDLTHRAPDAFRDEASVQISRILAA